MQIGKEAACAVGHIWNADLDQVQTGFQHWEGMKTSNMSGNSTGKP